MKSRDREEIELQFGLIEEKLDEETNLEEMEDEDFTDDMLRERALNSLDIGVEKLKELHDNGETNGDVSPDTFFLDLKEKDCKLIDFGLASVKDSTKGSTGYNIDIFLRDKMCSNAKKNR
jgi:serine/threonine protein kinase